MALTDPVGQNASPRRWNGFSLRWKLVLASLFVELVLVAALVWNGSQLVEKRLIEQATLRIKEVSTLLNISVGPAMAYQDYDRIADIFRDSRKRQGIEYFVLTDQFNRIVLVDGWEGSGRPPEKQAEFGSVATDGRFDIRIPITGSGQIYGQLAFGISSQFVDDARQQFTRASLAIASVLMLASGTLLTVIAFWLTRHLKQLEEAGAAVSAGRFDIELPISSQDEIGRVASAFNRMTAEIKRQINALQTSEERFRGLLELSTDWYWEQDSEFRFTLYPAGQPGVDAVAGSRIGKHLWDFASTLSEAEWDRHRAVLTAHQVFRDFEFGVIAPDGEIVYLLVCGEPMFDAQGCFTGYRGTAREITDRKRAEISLQLAASVFAEAREGIIITDAQWQLIEMNPMASELTGYRPEDMADGKLLDRLFSAPQPEFLEAALPHLIEVGHWRGETWGLRKNGERFPELLTASAVRDSNGRIVNFILIFSDITTLKEQQQRLERMAHYDALTRLPNRVLLAERLHQALAQAKRDKGYLAVAYLDLDGFKPVNDTLGHDAGDRLLVEVADRLRNSVRAHDTVARLGGDEFVLLIHASSFSECETAMQRTLHIIAEPFTIKGRQVSVSASIGIASFPADGPDPDTLLRNADQAMYVSKQAGRNRYHFFDAAHDRKVLAHTERISRIHAALPANEFVLHYQPKVNMQEGRVVGAEALIRWQLPERGLLPPGEFLPIIENSDFAVSLGEWVITATLAQMRAWRGEGIDLSISINIAARQLQAHNFVERLQILLAAYPDVPPDRLELEIVETAALDDIQYVNEVINQCLGFGVTFALDDFGTGYSSLIYFKRLPVRTVKIDQSFVRNMLADPEDMAIVEGVIGLAKAFHRSVIAEGVETAEQGARLIAMGCDCAQGYGIAHPMPAEQIPLWVRSFQPDPSWRA
jgi:diguanylate cyclase (GGDEF)-like protein/PAS domain S-box-containing protein